MKINGFADNWIYFHWFCFILCIMDTWMSTYPIWIHFLFFHIDHRYVIRVLRYCKMLRVLHNAIHAACRQPHCWLLVDFQQWLLIIFRILLKYCNIIFLFIMNAWSLRCVIFRFDYFILYFLNRSKSISFWWINNIIFRIRKKFSADYNKWQFRHLFIL